MDNQCGSRPASCSVPGPGQYRPRKNPRANLRRSCGVYVASPRALKRTSTAFLRQHYAPSSAAASAMAAYLAGIASEPAQQPKRSPAAVAEARPEPAKQQPKRQQPTGRTADQPQAAPSQASGGFPADAIEVRPTPAIENSPPRPRLRPSRFWSPLRNNSSRTKRPEHHSQNSDWPNRAVVAAAWAVLGLGANGPKRTSVSSPSAADWTIGMQSPDVLSAEWRRAANAVLCTPCGLFATRPRLHHHQPCRR